MPLFTKPQFNNVWASTGAKLTPDVAKISQGWVVEIPPHEFDNWMQNRQDALLAHLNQLGIPQWDNTVEYQAGKSYVQGTTTGVVYKALTTHSNVNPETDIQNNWVVAFEASGNALLKQNNLSDVPDKEQARINLGIATTEFYDARYLVKSNNLADVPNKASARNNLGVYSKTEVYTREEVEALIPAGRVSYYARQTAPAGELICNGQAVSRTTYAKLFAAIGTTFGAGNGTTTFNVPNLLGEFIRGWDSGRGVDTGRVFGSFQNDAQQRVQGSMGWVSFVTSSENSGALSLTPAPIRSTAGAGAVSNLYTVNFDNAAVTRTSFENRPRSVALLPCITTGLLS